MLMGAWRRAGGVWKLRTLKVLGAKPVTLVTDAAPAESAKLFLQTCQRKSGSTRKLRQLD